MRYLGHERVRLAEADPVGATGGWLELRVDLADPKTGLKAEVFYRILEGAGALRSWVRLSNRGSEPVHGRVRDLVPVRRPRPRRPR